MKISDILQESSSYRNTDLPLSNYRGLYDPRTDDMSPYDNSFDSASDLWDIVDDIAENGYEPEIINVPIRTLLATQDWLSTEPGDGPMWEEYGELPVVIEHDNRRFILDGHNRISQAKRKGLDTVKVYYFMA